MITADKSGAIAAAKASRQDAVDALRLQKLAAGFSYDGRRFQVDQPAQANMLGVFALLAVGVASPHGGVWRDAVNANAPMDDAAVKTFILAAKAHHQALLTAAWAHKDNLAALTTLATIEAYDIAANWPAS